MAVNGGTQSASGVFGGKNGSRYVNHSAFFSSFHRFAASSVIEMPIVDSEDIEGTKKISFLRDSGILACKASNVFLSNSTACFFLTFEIHVSITPRPSVCSSGVSEMTSVPSSSALSAFMRRSVIYSKPPSISRSSSM